jgi:hypothetical protein
MFGITQGTTATTYEPDGTIPRWQMALFIHRMFTPTGVAAAGTTTVPAFTDTSGLSSEIQAAITALASHGITLGTSATTYGPDENVTREQMAMFLKRFAGIAQQPNPASGVLRAINLDYGATGTGNGDHNYSDIASASSEGYESIVALYNQGVTDGICGAGALYTCPTTYRPGEDITRGEMASFIKRLLDQTNARPAGASIQSTTGIATAGAKDTMISVRNADFSVSANTLVDEFYDTADTAAERALAAEDPFDGLGVCRAAALATAVGTLCTIDPVDRITNTAGNDMGFSSGIEASHTTDWYVWTGTVGSVYNESAPQGYQYSVTMPATATTPVFATGASTTVTISGGDALGYAETLDAKDFDGANQTAIPAASDDGLLTYQGTSRTVTINLRNSTTPTATVVDGYTFKVVDKVVDYNGLVSLNTSYITNSGNSATYEVACSADPGGLVSNNGTGSNDYWEHHMLTITNATATGNGWPTNGADAMSGATFPTDGGGGDKVNIICDDEARDYTASAGSSTLAISQNQFNAAAGGSLVTITTTAYDQYGDGIAGVTSEITQDTDGAGAASDLATLTSGASGAATLTVVVCESTAGNANGTEAFAVTTAGSDFPNITATAANAGSVAAVEGTTVYCNTPLTNAATAGGDPFGDVGDRQEIVRVAFGLQSNGTLKDATAGSVRCTITNAAAATPAATTADIAHNVAANTSVFNDLANTAGMTTTLFAGNAVSLNINGVSTAQPNTDIAGAGFYLTFAAGTGNRPDIVCGDTLGSQADDLVDTDGGTLEATVTTLSQGRAGETWDLVDDDSANNSMTVKRTLQGIVAAGGTGNTVTYRSIAWDADDVFMTAAAPGVTEAAFETALAAITDGTTQISGMLRTVSTGTGISVMSLG